MSFKAGKMYIKHGSNSNSKKRTTTNFISNCIYVKCYCVCYIPQERERANERCEIRRIPMKRNHGLKLYTHTHTIKEIGTGWREETPRSSSNNPLTLKIGIIFIELRIGQTGHATENDKKLWVSSTV